MIKSTTSSIMASFFWDWSKNSTPPQEACVMNSVLFANNGSSESDYPRDVLTARLRFRGAGRALVVRFETSPLKDFYLIGHSLDGNVSTDTTGAK